MTAWSNPVWLEHRSVSRRESRRMSRRFAEVGVGIAPERIRAISMGRPATEDELVDVGFAVTVTELLNEKRRSKHGRAQRRCTNWLMVVAGVVVALNILLCMGLVLFILTQHTSPY
jgi:hypothetical protein